jgi:TonB family protein
LDSGGVSIFEVVSGGDKNGLRLLLARGADVNQTNKGGQTPLILAVVSGQVRLLPPLLEAGADPLLRDNTGLNAIEWAERKGFLDIASQLRERTTGVAKKDNLGAGQERPVHEPPTTSPPTEASDKNLADIERSRRWIAGIKQRLDEQATREQPAEAKVSTKITAESEGSATSKSGRSIETRPQAIERTFSDAAPVPKGLEPHLAGSEDESQGRRKCPQCNTVYNSDLVAYCAYHVVPLVDIDAPIEVPPQNDQTRSTVMLWLLVVITFLSAALIGLILFLPRGKQKEQSVAPQSNPTPVSMWKGTPVAEASLRTKIVDLPEAQTVLKIEKPETVLVRVRIGTDGHVLSVQSPAGNDELRRAAIDAARKATFSADKLHGMEVTGTITYTFNP